MIRFERYPHINDLLAFYLDEADDQEIIRIFNNGITNETDAKLFCHFIWQTVDKIHDDEESSRLVLNRLDNTDMLPDLSYEITKYMRNTGYYNIWEESYNENN